jgi:hypothetical protein
MKRHQVMDLFHGNQTEAIGEWHKVNDGLPNVKQCKCRVKLDDDTECFAYFYEDKALWIEKSTKQKGSYWWECANKEPLYDRVVAWKELKKDE